MKTKRFFVGVSAPWAFEGKKMWDVEENINDLSPDLLASVTVKDEKIELPLSVIEASNKKEAIYKYLEKHPLVRSVKILEKVY
jgi:hypothetical protein